MQSQKYTSTKGSSWSLWFERAMALLALTNLGLVLFDLSYVPGRDFYFRHLGDLTQLYDPIKGIEPHRDTQRYMATVEKLREEVAQTGVQSPQSEEVLQELQKLSVEMIEDNPFQVANKTGTLEKIKNRMRRHMFGTKDASSREAFQNFWSQEHLLRSGWQNEIAFYEREIKPLLAVNYYRHIGENGEFIEDFWTIDRWFIGLFLAEFLARTWVIHRRYDGLKWFPDAVLWRWYDVFLLLPFWQWLRVIPLVIRLNQAKFPDMEPARAQVSRVFLASFAEELTEVVIVQALDQMQSAVEKGDAARSLFDAMSQRYIDLNQTNEVEAIAKRLLQVTLCKVLPEIQPDLEALLRHNIETAFSQLPVYQQLVRMPGVGGLPAQLTEQLAAQISKLFTEVPQSAYTSIANAPADPVAAKLSDRLVEHFSVTLREELQQERTLEELQSLVSDLLEEIKVNYVQRESDGDGNRVLKETQQLRRLPGR
ncbi:hypothetical protein [Kamptonema formosum]|uniref:hypothetical protein n=1 Tax=Kamptonema formosum TaxID=331992 RepID=UPI000362EDF8|nr:hypothetical protein [Oscillatoria sp. PCC 10802]